MERQKILMVDPSSIFCTALVDALGGRFEFHCCTDGWQAEEMLRTIRPDILVTDLALPGVDGITLLKIAGACPEVPLRLVTTRFYSAYIEKVMAELGVDYVMLKPCDIRVLAERILDLSQCESEAATLLYPGSTIANILLSLNVPAGRKGYQYLATLIELYRRDPGRSLTKDLYPTVGRAYHTSGISVERDIRSVIETAWAHRDERVWSCYFPSVRGMQLPRPTNRTFIATVAEAMGWERKKQA